MKIHMAYLRLSAVFTFQTSNYPFNWHVLKFPGDKIKKEIKEKTDVGKYWQWII